MPIRLGKKPRLQGQIMMTAKTKTNAHVVEVEIGMIENDGIAEIGIAIEIEEIVEIGIEVIIEDVGQVETAMIEGIEIVFDPGLVTDEEVTDREVVTDWVTETVIRDVQKAV